MIPENFKPVLANQSYDKTLALPPAVVDHLMNQINFKFEEMFKHYHRMKVIVDNPDAAAAELKNELSLATVSCKMDPSFDIHTVGVIASYVDKVVYSMALMIIGAEIAWREKNSEDQTGGKMAQSDYFIGLAKPYILGNRCEYTQAEVRRFMSFGYAYGINDEVFLAMGNRVVPAGLENIRPSIIQTTMAMVNVADSTMVFSHEHRRVNYTFQPSVLAEVLKEYELEKVSQPVVTPPEPELPIQFADSCPNLNEILQSMRKQLLESQDKQTKVFDDMTKLLLK